MISPLFDPNVWSAVDAFELTDITYHRHRTLGVVRIAFNRPECRNAFRPSHRRRALSSPRSRAAMERCWLRAVDRKRTVRQRRRLGVLLRRRSAHSRQRWLQIRGRRLGPGRPGGAWDACTSLRCSA